jgi:hypothetical protein
MANKITFTPTKTYATEANADKAVLAKLGTIDGSTDSSLRYFIMRTPEGRFYPIFVGNAAVEAGIHFHFHVVG